VLNQGTVEFPSRAWLLLIMKRFFLWVVTVGKNQKPKGSLVPLINADVSDQRRLSRSGRRIPIAFLDADATEEQPVPVRVGAVEFPWKPARKQRLLREACALVGCP